MASVNEGMYFHPKSRLAIILCIADDKYTEQFVDKQLGFRSHKTQTPSYKLQFSRIEQRIIKFQEDLYARSVSENSWFRYEPCNRFQNEKGFGVKIVANVLIKKNKTITGLGGQSFFIFEKDIKVGVNDFSLFTRSRSQNQHVYLGPAAYANHDCESNAVFSPIGEPSYIEISSLKLILPGEEITVFYGHDYFGQSNEKCACLTCENKARGIFRNKVETMAVDDHMPQSTVDDPPGTTVNNVPVSPQTEAVETMSVGDHPPQSTVDDPPGTTVNNVPASHQTEAVETTMAVDDHPPQSTVDDPPGTTVNNVPASHQTEAEESSCSDTETSSSDEVENISGDEGSILSTDSSVDSPYKYHCAKCDLPFKYNCWFKRHMASHNPGTFACQYCPKLFRRRDTMREHQYLHIGVAKHKCEECAKEFSDKRNLNMHVKLIHEESLIQCPKCEKNYAGKRQLRYHDNRMHSLKNPYKCDKCKAAFPVPCLLAAHRVKMDHKIDKL